MADQMQSQAGAGPGINCPQCGVRFAVSLVQLVSAEAVDCPHCGLRLTVDRDKSREALKLARKLQEGIAPVQEIISPPATSTGRPRRRSRRKESN